MSKFTRDQFAEPDDEAGVFMTGLSQALLTWTAMQERTVTVAEAALSFNTTPEIITEAINGALWIYIDRDGTLQLDGA